MHLKRQLAVFFTKVLLSRINKKDSKTIKNLKHFGLGFLGLLDDIYCQTYEIFLSLQCNAAEPVQLLIWWLIQVMHIKLYVMASPWSGALLARQQVPKASDAANKFV